MDMFAGFIAFSSYFLVLLAIGVLGYWKADDLEKWARASVRGKNTALESPD